jgi:hypothetical protein
MTPRRGFIAAAAVVAAIVYPLSPLTVCFAAAIAVVVAIATRGLEHRERNQVLRLVAVAIVLRLAAITALFLATDHAQVPFGSLFGDEDYFIRRSLWIGNVARGVAIHPIDLEYAFEPNGRSSFLYGIAAIQALTGPAPYGLRLVGVLCYVTAALLLYRIVRPGFGRVAAYAGLSVMLFLPSLFVWSIGVLKEPPFVLGSALMLGLAIAVVRDKSVVRRAVALAGIVVLAAGQESLRAHGGVFSMLAIGGGLAIAFVIARPKVMLASLIAAPIVTAIVLSRPEVQLRAYAGLTSAARQHWGAVVVSRGFGYRLLDARFYRDLNEASSMDAGEAARYLARAAVAFVTIPRPWDAQSRSMIAYIPEQIVWYTLVLLVPVGVIYGFRRDGLLTGLLLAHAVFISAGSAITDGNVGTLVRHRGLALPYLAWLGTLGLCVILIGQHGWKRGIRDGA